MMEQPHLVESPAEADPAPAAPPRWLLRPGGRRLCWSQWGDPAGTPLLAFHGLPGSRVQLGVDPPLMQRLGVRLIGVDRPGLGRSDFQPGRRLLDWPEDVAALADHLGVERFAVMGLSGGGPYAAACAWALPTRVTRLGLISGLGPLDGTGHLSRMRWIHRALLTLARHAPRAAWPGVALSGWAIRHWARPLREAQRRLVRSSVDGRILDRDWLRHHMTEDLREAMQGLPMGLIHDAHLATRPWGFMLDRLRVPAWAWHGDADSIVPIEQALDFAGQIPGCRLIVYPGEGHFMVFDHLEAIVRTLTSD